MEFKGTKGKWHLMKKGFRKSENNNLIQVYATNEDLELICEVWKDRLLHEREQNFEANALLISKAPEMLELLQNINNGTTFDKETGLMWSHWVEKIQELIKEATEL